VCDISRDITPLLTSVPSSKGPDIRCAVGVGHPRVVVRDTAHSPCLAPFVRDSAELFLVSIPIAEQALIDPGAVMRGVPVSFAPLASLVVLLRAVLPPIRKVVEASVEHGSGDIRGHRGIMEDVWLEAAEGIGAGEGS
jgi:hypothetical protein